MNLLHFLHAYKEILDIELAIAHVNHQQRQSSIDEENYLKTWASEAGIPIHVGYFEGEFTETKAREYRYTFFKTLMREHNYTALVTAHHADDQVETIMMRWLRGSRLRHLTGISPVQSIAEGEIIRPFLSFSKASLPSVFHFEDDSNSDTRYFRNRVRQDYLPLLTTENPRLSSHIQMMGEEIGLCLAALSDLTKGLDVTDRTVFLAQSPAVQSYLLQDYLTHLPELQLSKAQFEEVLHLIRTKSHYHHHLKSGYQLILTKDKIVISKISPRTDGQVTPKMVEYGSVTTVCGYQLHLTKASQEDAIPLYSQSPILLRPKQAGDRLQLGYFSKKLSRLFIDDKVSLLDRKQAIVGEQDGEIVFVLLANKTYLRKSIKHDTIKARLHIQKETR